MIERRIQLREREREKERERVRDRERDAYTQGVGDEVSSGGGEGSKRVPKY